MTSPAAEPPDELDPEEVRAVRAELGAAAARVSGVARAVDRILGQVMRASLAAGVVLWAALLPWIVRAPLPALWAAAVLALLVAGPVVVLDHRRRIRKLPAQISAILDRLAVDAPARAREVGGRIRALDLSDLSSIRSADDLEGPAPSGRRRGRVRAALDARRAWSRLRSLRTIFDELGMARSLQAVSVLAPPALWRSGIGLAASLTVLLWALPAAVLSLALWALLA